MPLATNQLLVKRSGEWEKLDEDRDTARLKRLRRKLLREEGVVAVKIIPVHVKVGVLRQRDSRNGNGKKPRVKRFNTHQLTPTSK